MAKDEVMISQRLLAKYFEEVANLCAILEHDLKLSSKITSKTVVQLSKVVAAGNKINNFIDQVTASNIELN